MNAWRYYQEGAVKVRLQGLSPERFFNLCGQGEVEIWKISCAGAEYEFYMTVRGFFSCRPFVRKSGVRLKILEKTGLPFFYTETGKEGCGPLAFYCFFCFSISSPCLCGRLISREICATRTMS